MIPLLLVLLRRTLKLNDVKRLIHNDSNYITEMRSQSSLSDSRWEVAMPPALFSLLPPIP